MDTLIGRTISHYRIARELGRGGMGIVYLAYDTRLRRAAAIKALPEQVASDRDRLLRFRQEAQVLASLSHPNIAGIYGLEESDGRSYLALEYLEGETLAARIARGPLPIVEAVEICLQIAAGMEAAHEGGIIHRDLKPGNVMITRKDVVKVLDFGLSKISVATDSEFESEDSPAQTVSPATVPGLVLGTLAYLSPEQARGKQVDRRTDIWSFGCILFECLAGRRAFWGDTSAETIARILERDPDWSALPPRTPPALLRLLQHCLEKDQARRLRDIGDARLALEEVKAGRPSGPTSSGEDRPNALPHRLLPVGAVLLASLLGMWLWNAVGPGREHTSRRPTMVVPGKDMFSEATPSIAVLPFADLSPGKDQEYFAAGLSEELLNVLAKIRDLRVVSRTSTSDFEGRDVDLGAVAKKLNVEMIVKGSVRKAGNRLRITAQLIQVATDSHVWSQTYDRELEDIFAVQEDIAQSVVIAVRKAVHGEKPGASASAAVREEVVAALRGRGESAEAYRLYLQGRFSVGRATRPDVVKGIEYYQQALTLDPGFALAWAGLSDAYQLQAGALGAVPFGLGYGRAREAAERSLELEPNLAEGHLALGKVRLFYDWDWVGAESSMRRSQELAPGDARVAGVAATLASIRGRLKEAVAVGRRAVALDPLNVAARRVLGVRCYHAGLLDDAEAELNGALRLAPEQGHAHFYLSMVHLAQGRVEDAEAECEREPNEDRRLLGKTLVHHARGRTAESNAALRELIEKYARGDAVQIAEAYAYRGQSDRAFEWLERAYAQRDPGLPHMENYPLLRKLHADARWKPFLAKMGLAD